MVLSMPGPPRWSAGLMRAVLLSVFVLCGLYYFLSSAPILDSAPKPPTAVGPATHEAPVTKPPIAVGPATHEVPVTKPQQIEAPVKLPEYPSAAKPANSPPVNTQELHPIDTLIEKAEKAFDEVLKKESHDLKSAAKAYRERRGRHPPPGFDTWFKFAQENNAVIVEDFFDQIYDDLNPFWALAPAVLRKEGWDHEMTINIRNNNATAGSDWFWTVLWLNMTKTIEHILPDMDIPLNAMDEPRVFVPWEDINRYIEIERKERSMPPPAEVSSEFQKLPKPGEGDKDVKMPDKNWEQTRK